jgi:hypothetical protein
MTKLLKAYLNQPTLKNALKLRAYSLKHPMACVLLTQFDNELLTDAVRHAEGLDPLASERRA